VTFNVNAWLVLPNEFVAVIVTLYVPVVPLDGVPERTPVDVLNATPCGSDPEIANVGEPDAVTVKLKK